MRCKTVEKWLSDDLDGKLSGKKILRLSRHLEECVSCREYRQDLLRLRKETERLSEPLRTPAYWEGFNRRLDGRLLALSPSSDRRKRRLLLGKEILAVAGIALLAGFGLYVFFMGNGGNFEESYAVTMEESLSRIFMEIGPEEALVESFNKEVVASIEETLSPLREEWDVQFGDNPLFWESLSDEELAYIESELRKEIQSMEAPYEGLL